MAAPVWSHNPPLMDVGLCQRRTWVNNCEDASRDHERSCLWTRTTRNHIIISIEPHLAKAQRENDPHHRSDGSEGDGVANKASPASGGGGAPACVCYEEDLGTGNQRRIEMPAGTENHPWDPTELGCHIVHFDWTQDNIGQPEHSEATGVSNCCVNCN